MGGVDFSASSEPRTRLLLDLLLLLISRLRVWGFGFRVWGFRDLGFRFWGLGFGSLELRVWGFRV